MRAVLVGHAGTREQHEASVRDAGGTADFKRTRGQSNLMPSAVQSRLVVLRPSHFGGREIYFVDSIIGRPEWVSKHGPGMGSCAKTRCQLGEPGP